MSDQEDPISPVALLQRMAGNELSSTFPFGVLTKEAFLDEMTVDLGNYSDLHFSDEEKLAITKHLKTLAHGATAVVPLECLGNGTRNQDNGCPFRNECPLALMGKAPVGRPCLVELNLLQLWRLRFMENYQIDPNNFTEVGLANELAELEIYEMRINQHLAKVKNHHMLARNTVGFSREGEPLFQVQVNPLWEVKESIKNRKSKIIKSLVGDRQEKYKREAALKKRDSEDHSTLLADLRRKMEKMAGYTITVDSPKT